MLTRRQVLTMGGMVGGAILVPKIGGAGPGATAGAAPAAGHDHGVLSGPPVTAATITPFSVQMPVLPVLAPTSTAGGVDAYRMPIQPANVEIIPGLRTDVLSFGGGFVGPTIKARSGRRVQVTYTNQLDGPANVHLHGAHVPPTSDGYPMDLIDPGTTRTYDYPNQQQGTTLWYHDHTHQLEAEHVYRGLRGFYLLEGDDERRLNLPSGSFDVPIMLAEALFDDAGTLVFDFNPNRPTLLANGRPAPYFPVAARKYRFRLLNGATYRVFELTLGDGVPMTQIGSDGGLLPAPLVRTSLVLGPAERAEVVVDFSRFPVGTQLVLADVTGPVLRFDVARSSVDTSTVPARLRPLSALPAATNTREFTLNVDPAQFASVINGRVFDPNRVDATIRRGSTEIWKINNIDTQFNVDHTFHIHLVQFRVLDRDGVPPDPWDAGWKDTVLIRPGTSLRLQATFADYLGRYVFHCHMLEHSSTGMMAQMEIVS